MAQNAVLQISLKLRDLASKQLDRFGNKTLKRVAVGLAAVTAAAVGAAKAFVTLAKETAKVADEAGKFAIRIGESVENLTVLQAAGQFAGMTIQQVNMSLQRMTRRLGEAAFGTGEARVALDEMGLSAEDFFGLSPAEQFDKIARSLAGYTDQSQKLALAAKIFDTEGVGVLQMLEGGIKTYEAATEAARTYGAAISTDFAKDAAAFNDAQLKIRLASDAMKRDLAAGILPALTQAFEEVAAATREPGFTKALELLGEFAGTTTKILIDVSTKSAGILGWLMAAGKGIGMATGKVPVPTTQAPTTTSYPSYDAQGRPTGMTPEEFIAAAEAKWKAQEKEQELIRRGMALEVEFGVKGRERLRILHEQKQAYMELGPPIMELEPILLTHEELLQRVSDGMKMALVEGIASSFGNAVQAMSRSFGMMTQSFKKGAEALRSTFKRLAEDLVASLIRVAIQAAITAFLISAVFPGMGLSTGAIAGVLSMLNQAGLTTPLVGGGGGGGTGGRSMGGGGGSEAEMLARNARGSARIDVVAYQIPGSIDQQWELADIIVERGREQGIL